MLARDDAELRAAMKLVQYEFNRLIGSALFLSGHLQVAVGQGPNAAADWPEEALQDFCTILRDATLESFLIHVRNLIDFFIGPAGRQADDVVADDFFAEPQEWSRGRNRDNLHKVRARINKKLAHLTYYRLTDTDGWNPRDLVERLVVLRERFNNLSPAYRIEVDVKSLDETPTRG